MSVRTVWELAETIESEINAEIHARVQELAPDDKNFDEFRPLYLSVIRELLDIDLFIHDVADSVAPVFTHDIFSLAADSWQIREQADAAMEYTDTIEAALVAGIYEYAFYLAFDHLASLKEQYTD